MENNRQEAIRAKGFDMGSSAPIIEYGKIKVGLKTLNNGVLNLGSLTETFNSRFVSKKMIVKAMAEKDISLMREISNYFYETSGVYEKACKYFATMYRYD